MALQVSFRVVGVYCYFQNLQLTSVSPDSTVQEVMDAIKNETTGFDYTSGPTSSGKEIVDSISYDFENGSTVPFNASGRPQNGTRELFNQISGLGTIWQYYRSATGNVDGTVCEIKYLSQGQPSFATTALNYYDPFFGGIPDNFQISTYNLTWRLVQIEMAPENQAKFLAARQAALHKRIAAK